MAQTNPRTGPSNQHLVALIKELKILAIEKKVKLWKRIATELEKPTRIRRVVNLSRINKYCKDKETIIVPGKVLASGELDKKLTIAAFSFSDQALEKISGKSKAISIQELIKENPQGKKVRIIG